MRVRMVICTSSRNSSELHLRAYISKLDARRPERERSTHSLDLADVSIRRPGTTETRRTTENTEKDKRRYTKSCKTREGGGSRSIALDSLRVLRGSPCLR